MGDIPYMVVWYKILKFKENPIKIVSIARVLKTKVSGKQTCAHTLDSRFNSYSVDNAIINYIVYIYILV